MDALTLMPKFASTLKALIGNKEKLSEMARTPLNEHCSVVILTSLSPKNLVTKKETTDRFLIPCTFRLPGMDRLSLGRSWRKHKSHAIFRVEKAQPSKPDSNVHDTRTSGPFDLPTNRRVRSELTLRVDNEAITYNLDQTVETSNYNDMTANRIDVVELAYEEYSQEVLRFSDVIASGNPTPGYDPIVSNSSPTLTPFEDSDFLLLEEADAFLALADDPTSPEVDESYYDPEGDILILEAFLNTKTAKSSIDEPPEVELKDLPPHLEYAFLEDNNKLPVIIAKYLSVDEKTALIKVLNCPTSEKGNPKIHDVIKKEVEKLLDAGLIYPISDSPWVSLVHCVPKKGGMTVVTNDETELLPTRLVTGWRVCIDYRKLNEATRKDHFPLSFMDQIVTPLFLQYSSGS
ncbi:hypothetical protein Tco_1215833 [Tanacetum coccineum]